MNEITSNKKRTYACTFKGCLRVYQSLDTLNRHMKTHSNDRKHRCVHCGKEFSFTHHLKEHIRVHTGEKPYVCKYAGCSKKFKQTGEFSAHKKTHKDIESLKEDYITKRNITDVIKRIEAVYKQIRYFKIPSYFYTKLLPYPQVLDRQKI